MVAQGDGGEEFGWTETDGLAVPLYVCGQEAKIGTGIETVVRAWIAR